MKQVKNHSCLKSSRRFICPQALLSQVEGPQGYVYLTTGSFNAKSPDPRDRQSGALENHVVVLARKVALVPLSNTKSTIFIHVVGTNIQKRLFFMVRKRKKKKKKIHFSFSMFKCVGFYSTVLDRLNT